MDSSNGSHSCTICNKKYSSYKAYGIIIRNTI